MSVAKQLYQLQEVDLELEANEQAALRIRIKDLAQARVSYGYRRLHVLLQREGWKVNHKRVYRLYKQEGLMMRPRGDPGGMSLPAGV